jgi:protein-L-isoaspartate(D-aspartate) O-methyltransferase
MDIVNYLVQNGTLKSPDIVDAFRKIKRIDFLPEEMKHLADEDEALPIGWGQTISQPTVVAFMLELLQSKKGDKILDVGSGSGWTSALLGKIVGKEGKVYAIEIVPELKEFGEKNVSKYGFIKDNIVEFILGNGRVGLEKESPFDKILVSAAANKLPLALKNQLRIGGKIVIPTVNEKQVSFYSQSIWLFQKKNKNNLEKQEYSGFVFVPLINKKN